MKTQLKLLVSVLALGLAGASVTAAAEKPDHGGKRLQAAADQRLKQLDEKLQLTDDQKQKIKDIWAKEADTLKALSPEERRTKGRDAFAATHAEVRAVLTPDQQTKFDAMPAEGRSGKGKAKGKV